MQCNLIIFNPSKNFSQIHPDLPSHPTQCFLYFFFFMCACLLTCALWVFWYLKRPGKSVGSLRTSVAGSFKATSPGCQKLKPRSSAVAASAVNHRTISTAPNFISFLGPEPVLLVQCIPHFGKCSDYT